MWYDIRALTNTICVTDLAKIHSSDIDIIYDKDLDKNEINYFLNEKNTANDLVDEVEQLEKLNKNQPDEQLIQVKTYIEEQNNEKDHQEPPQENSDQPVEMSDAP